MRDTLSMAAQSTLSKICNAFVSLNSSPLDLSVFSLPSSVRMRSSSDHFVEQRGILTSYFFIICLTKESLDHRRSTVVRIFLIFSIFPSLFPLFVFMLGCSFSVLVRLACVAEKYVGFLSFFDSEYLRMSS